MPSDVGTPVAFSCCQSNRPASGAAEPVARVASSGWFWASLSVRAELARFSAQAGADPSVPADSLKADAQGPGGAPVLSIDTRSALATRLGDTRRGRELWLPFLVLAGVFLIGEILLGSARVLDR